MVWTRTLIRCTVCGKDAPMKANALTCSPACKQAAYRIRQKVKAGKRVYVRRGKYEAAAKATRKGGKK